MFTKEDPFPTPKELLDTCHTFFCPTHDEGTLVEDLMSGFEVDDHDERSFGLSRRIESMKSGWEYRDLQVDHVSPSLSHFTVLQILVISSITTLIPSAILISR
jgi:hypothetical protein